MQRRPLFWLMVSLLCLGGSLYFWRQGERTWQERKHAPPVAPAYSETQPASAPKAQTPVPAVPAKPTASVKTVKSRYPYRLSNTDKTSGQLLRSDKAIHLMNALIDTSKSPDLAIPERLRAPKDNGSYIVQARGPLDNNFRAQLAQAGASIVSYIPNNAYLVRVSEAGAQQLAAESQSVIPFQPYYKLEPALLKAVMEDKDLPTSALKVTLFPDAPEAIFDSLQIHTIATDNSPFGPVVTVPASKKTIVDIARLPGVQAIAPARERTFANDLSRVRVGAATDTLAATAPYLGLSGSNVLVNINDSGVDAAHPDLTGRITGSITDDNGHGTHVAGTILGDGAKSDTVTTNASGSVIPGASFRGMATNAHAYVLSIGGASDSFLQEQAAKTNALISNNSWNFGGSSDYDIEAASYDAAVRDALPGVSGSQPLLYVFSAGNSGAGDDSGAGGDSESILSPATAKNVITVGAMEQPRNITNLVVNHGATNEPWIGETDSDNQIASFSSRGNVGIGIEGDNGRFKPDVVAPGTFVISTRSTTWDTKAYYNPTNFHFNTHFFQTVDTNSLSPFSVFVPDNAVQLIIEVFTNRFSPSPFPDMPIYLRQDDNPTLTVFDFKGTNLVSLPPNLPLVTGASLFYSIGNPTNKTINFNVQTTLVTTNDDGNYLEVLSNLNNSISTPSPDRYYRYESGTSMSAAGVSGMLACMEEFFIQRLQITNPSPALMKALLINGARSVAQQYDLQVGNFINYQGWGLANLSNSIPAALTNSVKQTGDTLAAMRFFDQNPTNALATGQSKTYSVVMGSNSLSSPLRVTLVWTDPPGNPQAGTKLVNDLDLIVTNLDTGDVFYGNNIPSGSDFTVAWDTNAPPPLDSINNVENVFLTSPVGTNYSVTVFAHRVNVNAVTANTNDVVQDYALVIASGDSGTVSNGFTIVSNTPANFVLTGALTTLSNGIPLLNQRVGGNSQFAATTNGMTNQWNFYVYTNTTAFTNVAFVTFLPPNLGVPRIGTREEDAPSNGVRLEADIDLYVSSSPLITNLDPVIIAAADKSVTRTGTEKVLYSNSVPGQVYYIAVRSQDQEGAQYGFVGVASQLPFGQRDANGNVILTLLTTLPQPIPDGSPALPGTLTILALTTEQAQARRVLVTNNITHQNFGDLIGTLTHGQKFAVLNNHTFFDNGGTNETLIYDDSGEGDITGSRHTDGPGSLQDFVGDKPGDGIWILTMADNALTQTGTVNSVNIMIEPQPDTNGVTRTLTGGGSFFEFVDVPVDCTNLTVSLSMTAANAAPLQLMIKRGSFPTLTSYDKAAVINPPGGAISLSVFDSPPLNPGRYFIEVHNPNASAVTFTLTWNVKISLTPGSPFQFLSIGDEPILDDAVTVSTNHVGIRSRVVAAEVGVRIDHPRISDLVLTLISPQGTRVLLAENRGSPTTNYGFGTNTVLVQPPASPIAGDATANTTNIDLPVGVTLGTVVVNYNFFSIPDTMHIYYNGVKIFDSGLVSGIGTFAVDFGPGTSPGVITIIMNEGGNPNSGTGWNYSSEIVFKSTTYAIFTEDTNKTTVPIKFAVPPFGAGASFTQPATNNLSDFETVTNGDYNSVEGWTTLDTNTVKVVTVPAFAATGASGTNILALHSGSIGRTLPTVNGRSYTLNFVNHGRPVVSPVSWWPAELNFTDIAGGGNNGTVAATNVSFAPGEVSAAFNINGGRITVGNPTNLQLQDFSIDAWVQRNSLTLADPVSAAGPIIGYGAGGWCFAMLNDGTPVLTRTEFGNENGSQKVTGTNAYHHMGVTKSGTTVIFYVDGVPFQTNPFNFGQFTFPPSGIGIGERGDGVNGSFLGKIDELDVFNTILTDAQMQDIYAAGSAGKCLGGCPVSATMTLGTLVTNFFGNDVWTTNSYTFTATADNMTLQIQPNQNGMLVDAFQLVENPRANPTNFYMPEESLSKLIGEPCEGDWKLEVLDDRAGPIATNPAPLLVSWDLMLRTETIVPDTIPLTHAISVSNSVAPHSLSYFSVDVPPWAKFATNTLFNVSGGSVNLLFNQSFLPGSTNGGDFTLLNNVVANGVALLQTNGPAPQLLPGQKYYLAVQNLGASTVNFSIEVDFDITTLTNMIPVTNTLAASSIPRYYQYTVSSNAVAVSFQLLNLSGNVDLVARKGPPLPDTNFNDYISALPGINNESIVIRTNSLPVPLTPGLWYLGVFNKDIVPVTYTILATEYGLPTIIPLTDSIEFTTNFPPGLSLGTFFSFTITNTNTAALFELYKLNGNVDLTLNRGSGNYPYQAPFFATSVRPGTNTEQIVVRTNILGTNINDVWYMGVPNNDSSNVTFTIRAVASTNGLLKSGIPIGIGVQNTTNGLTFTWPAVNGETYQVQETANLFSGTNWTVIATLSNAPPYVDTFIDTNAPNANPFLFYRILQVPTP